MNIKTTLSIAGTSLFGVLVLGLSTQARAHGGTDRLIVVRDAETGQLRTPTADEAASMQATRAKAELPGAAGGALNLQLKRHSSGAVGARGTDELASYVVVAKRADGTLAEACFSSKEEAERAVRSGIVLAAPLTQQFEEK